MPHHIAQLRRIILGTMTDKEMGQELGDLFLKYQVQVQALKAQIRQNLRNSDGSVPEMWGDQMEEQDDPPFAGLWRDRSDQLRSALDEAAPDVPLIHVLHHHLTSRGE